jgi:hypothetical protein
MVVVNCHAQDEKSRLLDGDRVLVTGRIELPDLGFIVTSTNCSFRKSAVSWSL